MASTSASMDQSESQPVPCNRWSVEDAHSNVQIHPGGLEVIYPLSSHSRGAEPDTEACTVRADRPMEPQRAICYFEITIINSKQSEIPNTAIAIGFSTRKVSLSRLPGWESESWGYHGDDGRLFVGSNAGKSFGPRFGVQDTIGCGINFIRSTAFFTKNGMMIGSASSDLRGDLVFYPTVGMRRPGAAIQANFGDTDFLFNIDRLIQKERRLAQQEVNEASISRLAPPGVDESKLVEQMVMQFLQHDGHSETAQAFAQDLRAERSALTGVDSSAVETGDSAQYADAVNRQSIRHAVLCGDIDRALKQTRSHYRGILEKNDSVYFRLRCAKFVEMIRRGAKLRAEISRQSGSGDVFRGKQKSIVNHHAEYDSQDTETDDGAALDRMDSDADGQAAVGPPSSPPRPSSRSLQDQLAALDDETLEYGKQLRTEFGDDPRPSVRQRLEELFAVIAYVRPQDSPEVTRLLDESERSGAAEQLNSAILASQGKPTRPVIETLWAQTMVLLDEVRSSGGLDLETLLDQLKQSVEDPCAGLVGSAQCNRYGRRRVLKAGAGGSLALLDKRSAHRLCYSLISRQESWRSSGSGYGIRW